MKVRINEEFIEECVRMRDQAFRAVLEKDDLSLMEKYIDRYCPEVKANLKDWNSDKPERIADVMRRMAYKCIPKVTTFTPEERNKARQWLRDHNSSLFSWK